MDQQRCLRYESQNCLRQSCLHKAVAYQGGGPQVVYIKIIGFGRVKINIDFW